MVLGEKRPFSLHHSLHPSLAQVSADCFSREGFLNDILKVFGDLNSIFSFLGGDKVNNMAGVGWGELGGMAPNRFLKGGTVLRAKAGYGAGVDTSRRGYLMCRIARIK